MGVDCTCTLFTALFLILRMGLMSWNFLPFFKFTMKFLKILIKCFKCCDSGWVNYQVCQINVPLWDCCPSVHLKKGHFLTQPVLGVSSSKRWSSSKRQALLGLRYLGATKLNLFVHFATKMFRLTNYYLKQFAKSTIKD